jgi:phospholipid/cholesterol/gamma-HCH transport system permease protein
MLNLVDNIGKSGLDRVRTIRSLTLFLYLSLRTTLSLKLRNLKPLFYTLISQIYFTGVMAIPLITFIALATGSIVILQSTPSSLCWVRKNLWETSW